MNSRLILTIVALLWTTIFGANFVAPTAQSWRRHRLMVHGFINKSFTMKSPPRPKEAAPAHRSIIGISSSSMTKIEKDLSRARSAIRKAAMKKDQVNSSTSGVSIFRNEALFNRSYAEMEKRFKIYVYKEGTAPIFHHGPCIDIYSTEGHFIYHMDADDSGFVTQDPEKAHVFFLPFSVTMLVEYVYKKGVVELDEASKVLADYINVISHKYPYWNRSLAADHFMVSCHDWAPTATWANEYLHKRVIRVLCNANTSEGFDLRRDAALPEMKLMREETTRIYSGLPPQKRDILAFFSGGIHGPIRGPLFRLWENKDPAIQLFHYLPSPELGTVAEFDTPYNHYLARSRFCLCPSGYEVASPRLVEAIYSACVPVLISSHYVPPFADVLDYSAFSLTLRVDELPLLKQILEKVSPQQYSRLREGVLRVQRHFRVNDPPQRADMFYMILHSVWLRRLNIRLNG